jgi:hypothetical protein
MATRIGCDGGRPTNKFGRYILASVGIKCLHTNGGYENYETRNSYPLRIRGGAMLFV